MKADNANGGLMGHPIVLDYCDDQSNPQTASVCAQKVLVQDKALMLAGNDGNFDQSVTPVLASAHTIEYGPEGANLVDYTSPNVYLMEPEVSDFNEIPKLLPPGKHRVANFTADEAVALQDAKANGVEYTKAGDYWKEIAVPLTATQFSTPCLQAKEMNADVGIVEFDGLTQFAPLAQACQQLGVNLTWAIEGSVISNATLQGVSNLKLKNVIILPVSPKALADMYSDMKKYGPTISDVNNDAAEQSYVAFRTLPAVVAGAGSLNAATIQAWLNKQTAFNPDGYMPPINFTAEPFGSTLPRIKNLCAYKYVQTGSSIVLASASPTPYCFKPGT